MQHKRVVKVSPAVEKLANILADHLMKFPEPVRRSMEKNVDKHLEIQMHHVGSSNIAEVGYNQYGHVLRIKFHTKTVYDYQNVPLETYVQLRLAQSKGKYFDQFIKGVFPFRKVE